MIIENFENNKKRLSDIIIYGSHKSIKQALQKISDHLIEASEWVKQNKQRNERNLVLHNFLTASVPYIEIAIQHHEGPVQVLAFCARNLYEIYLRSRHVQKNPVFLQKWVNECATDHLDILEGILNNTDDSYNMTKSRDILKQEINRIEELIKKHGSKKEKPYQIAKVAEDLGLKTEYNSLFKFFSKLLHPTSYLVNSPVEKIQDRETRNLLLIHIQLYAYDILGNIQKEL